MSSPQERGTGYERDAPMQPGAHRAGTAPREAAESRQPGQQAEYDVRERERERYEARQAVAGAFTVLAATLMILSGLWGFFVGITGVLSGSFYARVPATFTFSLSPYWWGVVQAIIGGVVFCAGVCLLLGMAWARVVGIGLAVISGLANFLFLPHYPVWSIIVIALDVIIIWALTTSHLRRLALAATPAAYTHNTGAPPAGGAPFRFAVPFCRTKPPRSFCAAPLLAREFGLPG